MTYIMTASKAEIERNRQRDLTRKIANKEIEVEIKVL